MIIYEKGGANIMPKVKKGTPPMILGILWSLMIFMFLFLIVSPDMAAGAVRESLNSCALKLIPSLFPFLVLTRLFSSTGLSERLSRLFSPLCVFLGIPKEGASAMLLGAVGGFPTGAVMTRELHEKGIIGSDEASRLIAVSNNAGLAFCVGTVGGILYKSPAIGWKLWLSQLFAAFIILAVSGAAFRKNAKALPKSDDNVRRPLSVSELLSAFAESVTSAALTMIKICAFAVFFGVVGRVVTMVVPRIFGIISLSFCELTLAVTKAAALGRAGLPICAFALGFAGMSVHAQVAAVLAKSGISMRKYFLAKFIQGLISALMTVILC